MYSTHTSRDRARVVRSKEDPRIEIFAGVDPVHCVPDQILYMKANMPCLSAHSGHVAPGGSLQPVCAYRNS